MKHSRWWVIWLVVSVLLLAGCGDSEDDGATDAADAPTNAAQATSAIQPTVLPSLTPRDPAPRSRATPPGDPAAFEAPLSVGSFVRKDAAGQVTASSTGGLQASYLDGDRMVQLTMFRLNSPELALEKVQNQLGSNSVMRLVETPFLTTAIAYGTAEMRQGYLIAWSHYEWVYFAYTSGSLEDVQAFMEAFPY